jgi:hypothetical protein
MSKPNSDHLKLPIKIVTNNKKKDEEDDDEIVFIEKVENIDKKNEICLKYTQDVEEITFDSDDELISVFSMQSNNVNNSNTKSTVNNVNNLLQNNNDEEEEEDFENKLIKDNDAFFNHIDSYLIDLTKDDSDSEKKSHVNKKNQGKLSFFL